MRQAAWRQEQDDAERAKQQATREKIAAVNVPLYIENFLDQHTFADSAEAAMAIAAQVRAEFGECSTVGLEVATCAAYNRREQQAAQATKDRRSDWLSDFRAGALGGAA